MIMDSESDSSSILSMEPEIDLEDFELIQNLTTHEGNGASANPYMFEPLNDKEDDINMTCEVETETEVKVCFCKQCTLFLMETIHFSRCKLCLRKCII